MSPALNRSSALRRFKRSDAIEIRDGITFEIYTALPHMFMHTDLYTQCLEVHKMVRMYTRYPWCTIIQIDAALE